MGQNSYDVGDTVRITGTFTNLAGTNVDPSSVVGKYMQPDGTVVTVESGDITNSAVGVYYYEFAVNTAGTWYYQIQGTGSNAGAYEGTIVVTTYF